MHNHQIKIDELIPDEIYDELPVRDAIHIAVVKLEAGENLYRNDSLKLAYGTTNVALRADKIYDGDKCIGCVWPEFKLPDRQYKIEKGQKFWGMLFPNTVTGMVHHWSHPAFENVETTSDEDELWIRNFCDKWNFDYQELISAAISSNNNHETYDRYVVANGRDLHDFGELGEDGPEFWRRLERITNKTYNQSHRDGMGWSCSC